MAVAAHLLFLPFLVLIALAWLRRGGAVARGMGWVALVGGAFGVAFQLWWLFGSGQTRYTMDGHYLRVLPIAWWATLSGGSVQTFFEATASHVGPRPVTMSPWWYFYGLVWLKVLLAGALVGFGLRMDRGVAASVLLAAIGLGLVADAWFGRDWPWWGT